MSGVLQFFEGKERKETINKVHRNEAHQKYDPLPPHLPTFRDAHILSFSSVSVQRTKKDPGLVGEHFLASGRSVEVAVFRLAVPTQVGHATAITFSTCDDRTTFGTSLKVLKDECPDPWSSLNPDDPAAAAAYNERAVAACIVRIHRQPRRPRGTS